MISPFTASDLCTPGTGNVLKIQQLLHTCSEFHGNKEEEEGSESEVPSKEDSGDAKPADKEGEATEGGGEATGGGEGGDSASAKDTTKKSDSSKSKDVEMKDAESAEPGSLSEAGAHQAISVLGIALIAMGEEIGAEMALRTFNHLVKGR